jgi:uncharacterized YkwD family protein
MKKEKYLMKTKRCGKIRTAVSVLLCMIFIPLLVANGIFLYKEIPTDKEHAHAVINANPTIIQTRQYVEQKTRGNDDTITNAQADTTVIKEETQKEPETTATQTVATKPTTTQPATTKPATTKPPTTKPTTTQPPTTRPTTTQPPTTRPTTTQPATTKPPTTSNVLCIHLPADEQTMLNLINQERKCNGLPELKLDTNLRTVARTKSREMIGLNYFAHQSPVYGSPFEMMLYFGINYTRAGENIAMNTSVESAHSALMNSDVHRKTILRSDYTHIGIGAYQGVSGKYYTQMFACY